MSAPWLTRQRSAPKRVIAAAAMAAAGCTLVSGPAFAATPSLTAAPPPPSAIGEETPSWIQAAPNYDRTGLVIAVTTPKTGCSSNCVHLWVSHDGGASWRRTKSAEGASRPVIAVDSRGHDILFASSGNAVARSDDGGDSWVLVGASGTPAVSPTYAQDQTVAVATPQGSDYLLEAGQTKPVRGSGGSIIDMGFTETAGGAYPPVLLTGEDKQQRLPVIQQCSAQYVCSGSATLAGAVYFSSPVTLVPSSTYAQDGTVFAQSGRGIYKSVNGGANFAPLTVGDPTATATATPMLALAPRYSEQGPVKTAWAAVFSIYQDKSNPKQSRAGGGIYRTDDGGTTWHAMATPGPFDGGAMAVTAAPDGRLFAGYVGGTTSYAGLLCSTDGGQTWGPSCPKVGDASNDPGPAPGQRIQTCSQCPSGAPGGVGSSVGGANNALTQGESPSPVAGTTADPNIAHGSGGAAATAVQSGSSRSLPLVIAAILVVLLGLAWTAMKVRDRRRPPEES